MGEGDMRVSRIYKTWWLASRSIADCNTAMRKMELAIKMFAIALKEQEKSKRGLQK